MFQIEVAGLVININNRFDIVRCLCRDYITEKGGQADIEVTASDEEIKSEHEKEPEKGYSEGYTESVVIYKKISNALVAFDAFVMHSSVVEVNGKAYAFAAESGTGKSTHTRYWKEVLRDRITIINGDKPIYRFMAWEGCQRAEKSLHLARDSNKEELFAFGTPWCGKEGWQKNTSAPLKALCLLERGEKDEIFPLNPIKHLAELFKHFHLPGEGLVDMPKLIELIDRMLATVPVYRLRCRNDRSAAETVISYFGLLKEEEK